MVALASLLRVLAVGDSSTRAPPRATAATASGVSVSPSSTIAAVISIALRGCKSDSDRLAPHGPAGPGALAGARPRRDRLGPVRLCDRGHAVREHRTGRRGVAAPAVRDADLGAALAA